MNLLRAELWFLRRDRPTLFWLSCALIIATLSTVVGIAEVHSQKSTIDRLIDADSKERKLVLDSHEDWGSIAYYSFHFTYSPPSDFAFAAIGQRDVQPWKHRIRMLALEGQIYESDVGNSTFALVGNFDFAFVAAVLLPLVAIFLLHGLRFSEQEAGRAELLIVTSGAERGFWFTRALLRVVGLYACVMLPALVGGYHQGAAFSVLWMAALAVLLHLLFWWMLVEIVGRRTRSSTHSLTVLIACWLVLVVLAPTVIKIATEQTIEMPEGADILLAQREAVNDAWDLPKDATMLPFIERHPQWRPHANISRPFEWKWYFAFQQVGDQKVEALSERYRRLRCKRDRIAGWLAMAAPPVALERVLRTLAHTTTDHSVAYERSVRAFHARLRSFYYPLLFREPSFDPSVLADLPQYAPPAHLEGLQGCRSSNAW